MKIREDQLKIWSVAPGTTRAVAAYNTIKTALESSPILSGKKIDIYLQGSYGNSTNIKVDSDIDVVVQLNSVWRRDISLLTPQEQAAYNAAVSNSSYGIDAFKQDVLTALVKAFGQTAVDDSGNKAIKLFGTDSRLHADIVPALQYRIYSSFTHLENPTFLEGMKFKAKDGTEIENYPKIHRKNGEKKNADDAAGEHYKHLVRVIKNIRKHLVDDKVIQKELAPSYFIECLLYNVPHNYFSDNYQESLQAILRFLQQECEADKLVAGNHVHYLFGDNAWQWKSKDDAARFLTHVNNFLGV